MVFEKFYNFNLENPRAVLSTLERITDCHSYGSGVVFCFPELRLEHKQEPYFVNEFVFYANSKYEMDLNELRTFVKFHLEPTVILYRSRKNKDKYWAYFLPEAINGDPSYRVLRSGFTNNGNPINNHKF